MGILDAVAYLNKNPLRETADRHGTPAEELEARKLLTQSLQNKNARHTNQTPLAEPIAPKMPAVR